MGIVKVSDGIHECLRIASSALCRSINAQAEHWLRVGMLAELHPELGHKDICRLLIQLEQSGGITLSRAAALDELEPVLPACDHQEEPS